MLTNFGMLGSGGGGGGGACPCWVACNGDNVPITVPFEDAEEDDELDNGEEDDNENDAGDE